MPKQFVKKKSAQEIGLADAFLFQRSGNRGKYAIPFQKSLLPFKESRTTHHPPSIVLELGASQSRP
jgi:hypothetical protein